MIILYIILAFIIGVYIGVGTISDNVYSLHRINEEEYRYLRSIKGFIEVLFNEK